MLRLKSHNTCPPSGFSFIDKGSGFKAHGWSVRSTASQWYHEQLRRGQNRSVEECMADVEKFTCEELMKTQGWQQWVMITDVPRFVPHPIPLIPKDARISVVVPIYENNIKNSGVDRCVTSVFDQANEVILVCPHFRDWGDTKKIRFVDAGSMDLGFSAKCNLGASKSTSPYIWFLNDDCYPSPGCAAKLMETMNSNPKIAIVGHLLRYPNGRIQHGGTQRLHGKVGFPHIDHGSLDQTITEQTEMEAVTAASMLVRREAFEAVGGFDEGYFLYLEDSDLCLKVRQAGWKVAYTPFAEAIHEEHASSKLRSDLWAILKDSTDRFQSKWKSYFEQKPPVFEPWDKISQKLKIDALYVHLVGNNDSERLSYQFVESVSKFPPGADLNWVIALNSPNGQELSTEMKQVFEALGPVTYFKHDNSGWDIGAFQAYSKTSKADFVLLFGSSSYARKNNWALPMITAFKTYGPNAIYGVTANLGNRDGVSPHLRTTAFWCTPELFNRYPTRVTKPEDRYPFEHGQQSMTVWAWSQGYQVYVVETENVFAYPDWDNGPEGFQRGTQKNLLFGDRITSPPYFAHP